MRIGYARVSTDEQSLEVQLEQLKAAGCRHELIYQEKRSGKDTERWQLKTMLNCLGHGDVIMVTKLDRLARSTADLLAIVERIGKAGASFVSLSEPWADTTSPAGKLIMTVFAGVAQFERERMMERCTEGRKQAKTNGVKFGRKPSLTLHQRGEAIKQLAAGTPTGEVARTFDVDPSTIRRLRSKSRT